MPATAPPRAATGAAPPRAASGADPMRAAGPPPVVLWLVFGVIGVAWGATHLLSKLIVREGLPPLGIALLGTAIGVAMLTPALVLRGGRLPLGRRHLVLYAGCGVLGTVVPHWMSYAAMVHLPVGIMSILMSLVPMLTLALALLLGLERAQPRRALGLGLGALAVVLLVGPDASLPDRALVPWVLVGGLVALSYAGESAFIALVAPPDLDPLAAMTGLTWAALILLVPLVWATGSWVPPLPLGPAHGAIVAMSVLHIACYLGFIWLIGRGGPVYAVQVSYPVTLSGVLWGVALLGEAHSPFVWAALALMLAGLALVKPRRVA